MSQPLLTQGQDGYTLIGSARSISSPNCYQLTPASDGQTGAVWFDKQLRLTESFELIFSLNFGTNAFGADGIAVVFQTRGKQIIGGSGKGIGYKGLRPSLDIEFDTNQNIEEGDPIEDHVALASNGVIDHRLNTNFITPVSISTIQKSVKDGRDHNVKVSWVATTQKLLVEIDCVIRINQHIDLINNIFSGVSEVYWGFTAATGSANNTHTVCIQKIAEVTDTLHTCRNDQIILTAPLSFNNQYQWSPSAGLDNTQSRTPQLTVTNSQLYVVQYTDRCGQLKIDSIFVNAKGVNLSIGDDKQICEGDSITLLPILTPANVPATYQWSSGHTSLQLKPAVSGQYSLTVIADGCSASDSATVTFNPLPKLGLSGIPAYDCPYGQSIQLDPQATGSNLQYSWTPVASKESTLLADAPGTYAVQITTGMGCSATQGFSILNNCPSVQVFVPDAFTPNGDGLNDILTWKGENNLDIRMTVFNRWGEVLFVSTTFSPYWDGTYQGKPCLPDTYSWRLEYWSQLSTKQQRVEMQGKVLLLK